MPRIRTIKPEFFSNEKLSTLPPASHLLAAGLLCYADDEGYFNANPGLIRAHCNPLREDSVSIQVMLMDLSKIGFLQLAEASDGKKLGRIAKFLEHQNINRPTPSKLKQLWPITEPSVKPPDGVIEGSSQERKGKERNVREQGKDLKPTQTAHATPPPGVAEQPEAAPAPSGVRVMPSPWRLTPEHHTTVDRILLDSPPGLVAGLSSGTITPADRAMVIGAAKREAEEHRISPGEALEGLLAAVQHQAKSDVRNNLFGGMEKYFSKAKYRVNPDDLKGENTHATRGEKVVSAVRAVIANDQSRATGAGNRHDGSASWLLAVAAGTKPAPR